MHRTETFLAALILGVALVLGATILTDEPEAEANTTPLQLVSQYAVAEADGVDVLATDLAPRTSGAYRINVIADASVTFSIEIKDADGVLLDVANFNGSTGALTADAGYGFSWIVRKGSTYNFQVSGAGAAVTLEVDFIKDGTN